jgi:hypothetical protein
MDNITLNTLGNSIWDIQLQKAKALIDVQQAEAKLYDTVEYKDLEFKRGVLRQYESVEEDMKQQILLGMDALGLKSMEFINQKVTLKNNPPSVKINDEELIPDKFKKEKVSITIDKTAIKKAIQDGEEVIGAELVVNKTLLITPKGNA